MATASLMVGLDSAEAQSRYLVTVIAPGHGYGINRKGDVCGALSSDNHAFLYIKNKVTDLGVFTMPNFPNDLCMTAAYAVNDSDMVVGHIADVPNGGTFTLDSFLYQKGAMLDIAHGSQNGGFSSFANGINNAGVAVGSYDAGERLQRLQLYLHRLRLVLTVTKMDNSLTLGHSAACSVKPSVSIEPVKSSE